ncbi:wings apart-like protein homolog isoform X1 [Ixodes scapularis]|uniref:wings apart-like protein homolog isoform X1 n=1 Tax=Ixodes scapularis TaxID=6945 RepID=UPI001A9FB6EB|nr:wings apart-like protein homolog isoform X1 [Ixodes scapularis]
MSKFGAKTYGRKHDVRLTPQIDQIVLDKGDSKASSAKMSVAAVHRWGVTSFTSLRKASQANGQTAEASDEEPLPLDSRETLCTSAFNEDPFSFDGEQEELVTSDFVVRGQSSRLSSSLQDQANCVQKTAPKPKKFFKSRNNTLSSSTSLASQTSARAVAQFDKLRSASNSVTSRSRDGRIESSQKPWPVPSDDNVDFRCVKLEKISRAAALSKDFAAPAIPPVSVRPPSFVVLPPAVQAPQGLQPVGEEVRRRSPSPENETPPLRGPSSAIRTYSRKRNAEATDLSAGAAPAKMAPVVPPSHPSSATSSDLVSGSSSVVSPTVPETNSDTPRANDVEESADDGSPDAKLDDVAGGSGDAAPLLPEDKPPEPKASSSRCIFKSKRIFQSPKKPKAVYKMRHWQTPDSEEAEQEQDAQSKSTLAEEFEDDLFDEDRLTKEVHQPARPWQDAVTSVKCPRKAKELYTVVRNVKQAYQCHESGETQEFNDDIDYLLEGVQPSNPIAARCLSVVSLASKCMVPAFRMHLRAHGIMSKFFSALTDAPSDPCLSLCTATLFFVLSQDRLTMDLDASTLSLMLQLFESDPQQQGTARLPLSTPSSSSSSSSELMERHREKVQQLCEQMQQKGHAKHLNLNRVNTGTLALETLLSLTSRRAGEWFKEELRLQGGLTHIVNTVRDCLFYFGENVTVLQSPTEFQLEKLRKIDRCSRVLENVTYMNSDNQMYLLEYKDSLMVASYIRLLLLCQSSLMVHHVKLAPAGQGGGADVAKPCESQTTSVVLQNTQGPGAVFFSCLLSVLRVLLNITHESPLGSSVVGSQPGLLCAILLCILQVPRSVPSEQRFDLLVLSLGLLINMVEHCESNRERLVNTETVGSFESVCDEMEMPAFNALMDLFTDKLDAARLSEEQADELFNSQEQKAKASLEAKEGEAAQVSQTSQADDLEETIMKALQKAGKHMEHSIICAYIALLLGCVVQNNKEFAEKLREHTPDGNFVVLVEALKKFHNFINLTGVLGNTATRSIQRVIEVLEDS